VVECVVVKLLSHYEQHNCIMKKYILIALPLLSLVACDYLPASGNKNIIKLSKDTEHYSDDMIPADTEPDFSKTFGEAEVSE